MHSIQADPIHLKSNPDPDLAKKEILQRIRKRKKVVCKAPEFYRDTNKRFECNCVASVKQTPWWDLNFDNFL
jgi:hypothetical protein